MTTAASRYPHLLTPIEIGPMRCRNRILQSAHSKLFVENGVETDRNVAYQRERARGGLGLIITGNHLVHPTSPSRHFAAAYAPDAVAANRRVTRAVHAEGARIICQLNHLGSNEVPAMDSLTPFWGPSSGRAQTTGEIAKAMEKRDIRELVEWWGRCSQTCREAEFDGVELHVGHGWLLHQFLSPIWNRRKDEYGGSFENRARLVSEVLAGVRARVGRDYVVGARVSLMDGVDGGLGVMDAIRLVRLLSGSGGIDYAIMTGGGVQAPALYGSPSDLPGGHLLEATARLKSETGIVVLAVGGINQPEDAERVIRDGVADMVALTREQIADPEFANKIATGREDEITHCIRANQGCIGRVNRGLPIGCTVNPAAGREALFGKTTLQPAVSSKHWLVVGAGPAGLKAALGLAERGHSVDLHEASDAPGGQVKLIVRTPGRERLGQLVEDLVRHLRRHRVDISLRSRLTAPEILGFAHDGVVIATGARPTLSGRTPALPLRLAIRGVEQGHVVSGWDVVAGTVDVGRRVVLLEDDGTRYAAGVAEVLLDRGHDVELVTPLPTLFPVTALTGDMGILYARLMKKGLRYSLGMWGEAIEPRAVSLINVHTAQTERREDIDTVVLVGAREPADELYFELADRREEIYRIGDCVAPRTLDHAVFEGFAAGRELWTAEARHIAPGRLEKWEDAEG